MDNNNSSQIMINQLFNIVIDVLKRWQLIILVTVSMGLIYDTCVSVSYVPMYKSSTTFAVKSSSITNNNTEGDLGETFSYIFQSNIFKKTIQKEMGVEYLNGYYSASVQGDTNVLHVSAISPSVSTSYKMMKALMENYTDISRLVVGNANIDVVQDATVPTAPYNKVDHVKNIVFVGGIGFVLIVGILSFLSFARNTIKDKYEIESKLHLHLLGSLPKESKIVSLSLKEIKKKKSILISQYSTSFHYIESFKRLRNRIEKYCKKHKAKVIMVTSSLENEGKSSVAVNTALSLALSNHKVLLIDGDLRKPSLHLILDESDEHKGIEHVLFEDVQLEDAIVTLDNHKLDILFGYCSRENTSELIQSVQMEQLLQKAREQYDYVIVDSSPSRFLSDSRMMATLVDGIVLVVKQNFADVSTIMNTIDKLTLSKTTIIGCVNNQSYSLSMHFGKYYGYNYGYNRYYHHRRREEE